MEVERHRAQAEKNLEAALEAAERMLGHVSDRELNDIGLDRSDIPRVADGTYKG